MNDFFARGGRWVLAQGLLLVTVAVLAVTLPVPFSFPFHQPGGWTLVVIGVGFALVASAALGSSLSPFPAPLEAGRLVATGPYRLVRHPIYTGVILGSLGIAVARGDWLSLLAASALILFFYAKSTHEEVHLMATYPEYAAYRQRVTKRIIPRVL